MPTSNTIEISRAALRLLEQIYVPGVLYKKSGVIVSDIEDTSILQLDLFDNMKNRPEQAQLMKAIDHLNHRYGLKTVRLCIEGDNSQAWKSKHDHQSPNYLTDINEILTIRI